MKRLTAIKIITYLLFTIGIVFCAGCGAVRVTPLTCTVIFEDNPSLFFTKQVYDVRQQEDLAVTIGVPHGMRIASLNYDNYSLSARRSSSLSYDYYSLTLHEIAYSALIRLTLSDAYTTSYHLTDTGDDILLTEEGPHIRPNSLPFQPDLIKEGYLPIGWNTSADASGRHIGFGSRFDHSISLSMELYAEWLPCTDERDLEYIQSENEITITGYKGTGNIVIPPSINHLPVTTIAAGAFGDIAVAVLALPYSIRQVEDQAFGDVVVEDFYFYDNVEHLRDSAFASYQISHLHINAVENPVYSGSYFDTLADKVDYLFSLRNEAKIVLFGGSSVRFGYDSPQLEAAFPDYKVVNMGVYAYSNMLPQAEIIRPFMKQGDILVSSPELDAIDTQFCGSSAFDKETYCMLESNYDMLSGIDCQGFTNVFSAFDDYNTARSAMKARSYLDSPSYYNEEGDLATDFSYNRYGDYVIFRENNQARKSFGIKRAYYHPDYIKEQDLAGINRVYDSFSSQGILVLFTYSPRSRISISDDSTPDSIVLLDELLQTNLHAKIISPIEASLMDPLYFYGTDNHLSSEGAEIRTKEMIEDITHALKEIE